MEDTGPVRETLAVPQLLTSFSSRPALPLSVRFPVPTLKPCLPGPVRPRAFLGPLPP